MCDDNVIVEISGTANLFHWGDWGSSGNGASFLHHAIHQYCDRGSCRPGPGSVFAAPVHHPS